MFVLAGWIARRAKYQSISPGGHSRHPCPPQSLAAPCHRGDQSYAGVPAAGQARHTAACKPPESPNFFLLYEDS